MGEAVALTLRTTGEALRAANVPRSFERAIVETARRFCLEPVAAVAAVTTRAPAAAARPAPPPRSTAPRHCARAATSRAGAPRPSRGSAPPIPQPPAPVGAPAADAAARAGLRAAVDAAVAARDRDAYDAAAAALVDFARARAQRAPAAAARAAPRPARRCGRAAAGCFDERRGAATLALQAELQAASAAVVAAAERRGGGGGDALGARRSARRALRRRAADLDVCDAVLGLEGRGAAPGPRATASPPRAPWPCGRRPTPRTRAAARIRRQRGDGATGTRGHGRPASAPSTPCGDVAALLAAGALAAPRGAAPLDDHNKAPPPPGSAKKSPLAALLGSA
ncbi:hypothetical protein JL722_11767 [Aureococcus anophagefferens]|nr:hypothetical protein JL722_11767 [Aureococcus anophagefferens]